MSTSGIESDPVKRKALVADINLSVLRRADAHVRRVLGTATHVALYELFEGAAKSEWRRCDMEGSLFIVERDVNVVNEPNKRDPTSAATNSNGRFRLYIFNRKNLNNYADDLVIGNKDIELNNEQQTIMYKNSKDVTVGIWFYQIEEASQMFDLMKHITTQGGQFPIHKEKDKGGGGDGDGKTDVKTDVNGKGIPMKSNGPGINSNNNAMTTATTTNMIAAAVSSAQRNGQLGSATRGGASVAIDPRPGRHDGNANRRESPPLTREEFRGMLQRMFADRRLFDGVYSQYVNVHQQHHGGRGNNK